MTNKKYVKEELEKLTTKELRDIAKDFNIAGRWDMTKPQLTDAILGASVETAETKEVAQNEEKVEVEEVAETTTTAEETVEKDEKQTESVEVENQKKEVNEEVRKKFVVDAMPGAIVAFKDGKRVRSAMVMRKNTKKELLKLENKVGQEFIVSYNDVIWVRTSKRWPKGVYNLLTGGTEAYEKEYGSASSQSK